MSGIEARLTHIGGPTVLIEAGGWRLLTDPTFDPPGQDYRFGWGTGSRKLTGPAMPASELGPIDAVLLSHDHHDDNLDAAGRALLPSAGTVITTAPGAKGLGGHARGLEQWGKRVSRRRGVPRSTSPPRRVAMVPRSAARSSVR
jgi:L-ascorbate metabolism protein UlaG (beta-lactamase superfamily)